MSENYLSIANNDDEEIEEIVAEADNEEKVVIEIVNKKSDEFIDDISSVSFIIKFFDL